jgi:hypothetical protein
MKISAAQVIIADEPQVIFASLQDQVRKSSSFAPAVGDFFEAYLDLLVDETNCSQEALVNKAMTAINLFTSDRVLSPCIRLSPELIARFLTANSNLAVSVFPIEFNSVFKSLINLCERTSQSTLHLLTSCCKIDLLVQVIELASSNSDLRKALWISDSKGNTALDVAKALYETKPYQSAAMTSALKLFKHNIS